MGINQAVTDQSSLVVKMKVKEFSIPPINDALVIGIHAPIGSEALRRSVSLLHVSPFEILRLEDDTIGEILVRSALLKKINRENLVTIVMKKVKPFMSADEVIHLDIHVELVIEETI